MYELKDCNSVILYVRIYKGNGLEDSKKFTYSSSEDCKNDIENWMNNPNYLNQGYTKEEKDSNFPERYFLKLKRVA